MIEVMFGIFYNIYICYITDYIMIFEYIYFLPLYTCIIVQQLNKWLCKLYVTDGYL